MQQFNLAKLLDLPQLPRMLKQVDICLNEAVSTAPPSLAKPLAQLLKSSSKRLRPALVVAAASLGTDNNKQTIQANAAIELIHLGSLVHDDIIDRAEHRWGKPTVHKTFGLDQALLVGDYLLAKASWQASQISIEAATLISDCISKLIEGESLELSDNHNLKRSISSYTKASQLKTGCLMATACQLGGLCGSLTPSQISQLGEYGVHLGLSFQIMDDLLDILSSDELMGKPVGNDMAQGLYTMPILFINSSKRAELIKLPPQRLVKTLYQEQAIQKTIKQIEKNNSIAASSLASFGPAAKSLQNLPKAYSDWALANLIAIKK